MRLNWFTLPLLLLYLASSAYGRTQEKGQPGKFDFYLLNLSWSPEFCSIQGTSPQCKAGNGFVVHGLWPQNKDGSYPVFCSALPGPAKPELNLDITPDLPLLEHEWAKHGTCTTMSPEAFFAAEHLAYHRVAIPGVFKDFKHDIDLNQATILRLFSDANRDFPPGSIVLSCEKSRLTAVEACLTKDLQPTTCKGLKPCEAKVLRIAAPQTPAD